MVPKGVVAPAALPLAPPCARCSSFLVGMSYKEQEEEGEGEK